MTQSKNGQWIIDDPRYQFIIENRESLEIFKIKRYSFGYNSVCIIFEMNDGKLSESTYPRSYFKRYTFPNIQLAMAQYLIYYSGSKPASPDVTQRIFEYKKYLIKKFPEILI